MQQQNLAELSQTLLNLLHVRDQSPEVDTVVSGNGSIQTQQGYGGQQEGAYPYYHPAAYHSTDVLPPFIPNNNKNSTGQHLLAELRANQYVAKHHWPSDPTGEVTVPAASTEARTAWSQLSVEHSVQQQCAAAQQFQTQSSLPRKKLSAPPGFPAMPVIRQQEGLQLAPVQTSHAREAFLASFEGTQARKQPEAAVTYPLVQHLFN